MGAEPHSIPEKLVFQLARTNDARVFVEVGTLHGATTKWASTKFETVHTIERSQKLYDRHSAELGRIRGVTPHLGEPRHILPEIVKELGTRKAVFWLDGHWSGGEPVGANDECPLLDELTCIAGRSEDMILINDARLFLCAPPLPYKPSQWPTIQSILAVLCSSGNDPFVQIVDDVIIIVPDRDELRDQLVDYAQERSTLHWNEQMRRERRKTSVSSRLREIVARGTRRLVHG